jgi:hypothetical protein
MENNEIWDEKQAKKADTPIRGPNIWPQLSAIVNQKEGEKSGTVHLPLHKKTVPS